MAALKVGPADIALTPADELVHTIALEMHDVKSLMLEMLMREEAQHGDREAIDVVAVPVPSESAAALPPGWHACFDTIKGLPYYFNLVTKESQWDRPVSAACRPAGQCLDQ